MQVHATTSHRLYVPNLDLVVLENIILVWTSAGDFVGLRLCVALQRCARAHTRVALTLPNQVNSPANFSASRVQNVRLAASFFFTQVGLCLIQDDSLSAH